MNNIPRINIEDLYETKQKNDIQKVETFNKLLEKIHERIKIASRQRVNSEFCYYIMPEVLIGYPNYNFEECLFYILSCLKNDNFLTRYIHPNLILISWRHIVPRYVRDEIHSRTGKKIDIYGKDIIDNESKTHESIIVSQPNDKKTIVSKKSASDYKSSGKFIYDKDVLDRIHKIL